MKFSCLVLSCLLSSSRGVLNCGCALSGGGRVVSRGEVELLVHWPWHITDAWKQEMQRAADETVRLGAEDRRGRLVRKEWARADHEAAERLRVQRETQMVCAACGATCGT